MRAFQTVGIIGKQEPDARVAATLRRLLTRLRQRGHETLLDPVSAALLHLPSPPHPPDQALAAQTGDAPSPVFAALASACDLVIVIGGDGTFLHVARDIAATGTPVLGINLGRLGFLVDLSPECIETRLDEILDGEFDTEYRGLLETRLLGADPETPAPVWNGRALNEAVIAKWETVRMIDLDIHIDGQFVHAQRSDGLIVATPTGSTAYALSGGGPLIHPSLDSLLLVPICPHTLSNRPLVMAGTSEIDIRLGERHADQARLTCDGQVAFSLAGIRSVQIRRSALRVRLLHPRGHDHFRLLRAKLGWGAQTQEQPGC